MSAFTKSGRSIYGKSLILNGGFRPEADIPRHEKNRGRTVAAAKHIV